MVNFECSLDWHKISNSFPSHISLVFLYFIIVLINIKHHYGLYPNAVLHSGSFFSLNCDKCIPLLVWWLPGVPGLPPSTCGENSLTLIRHLLHFLHVLFGDHFSIIIHLLFQLQNGTSDKNLLVISYKHLNLLDDFSVWAF